MSALSFNLSDETLRRLCTIFHIPIREISGGMVFFGIRGALPPGSDNASFDYSSYGDFKTEHELKAVQLNYFYPRCMLGQWLPQQGKVALFPGSTIPNLALVYRRRKRRNQFNQLVPGCYVYRKGQHPYSDEGFQPHKAFRMQGQVVVRRTDYQVSNDQPFISYGMNDSSIMVSSPGDNIHAARNNPKRTLLKDLRGSNYSFSFTMADYYSSYGCQVIVGNPSNYLPSGQTNGTWNAWDRFQHNAYAVHYTSQQEYKYLLFTGLHAYQVSQQNESGSTPSVLGFGSKSDLVEKVQEKLNKLNRASSGQAYYQGRIDGDFGPGTAKAVLNFQKDFFNGKATNFVSTITAKALGINDWPNV